MSFKPASRSARGLSLRQLGPLLFLLLWVASGVGAFAATSADPRIPLPAGLELHQSPAGQALLNRDEALALAFPKCEVKRSTAFLAEADVKRIASLAKIEFTDTVVYPYRATKNGKWVGTAYFDTHRVRSLRETVMVVVKPDKSIGRVEVLSFAEPKEYLPRDKWYAQFLERKLDDDLNLNRKIRGVTGATLTSVATTACCRRTLALDQVLREAEAKRKREEEEAAKKKGSGTSAASDS